MNCVSRALLAGGFLCAVGAADAAETTTPSNPILTPAAAVSDSARPVRPRSISPETAQRLASVIPPFTPPAPPQPVAATPEPEDKPRNGIIRLPRYEVREKAMRPISEYQMLTPRGKLDLALKLNPGLRFGSFGIFRNDGVALAMLEEEASRERRRQIADLMSLLPASGDTTVDRPTKRLISDAMMPRNWTVMAPSDQK